MNPLQHQIRTTCSRREWLTRTGMGLGSLALASLFAEEARAQTGPAVHHPAQAKRVIHLFLEGAPSHVDTFDPKPRLKTLHGKPVPMVDDPKRNGTAYASPFEFRKHGKSGLEISEIFPQLAKRADDLCIVRSMHTDDPGHESAMLMMNCGNTRFARPSLGAWVGYGLGNENRNLPSFISICKGDFPLKGAENWQSAFLPGAFQGTPLLTRDDPDNRLPLENLKSPTASDKEQRLQLDLLKKLNAEHAKGRPGDARLEARIESFELAARMQTEASEAFEITRETKATRELYGNNIAGRQCLMARRLAERGVRFVQAYIGGWDHHEKLEEALRKEATDTDQAIAALLYDLKQRGLLQDTLVIIGGEFGRTPTIDPGTSLENAGRDHNHRGFSLLLAGGGVKAGMAYGATDDLGFAATENKVHVHDLHATILHLLGFDHTRLTYRYAGRDFRLTDVRGEVVRGILAKG